LGIGILRFEQEVLDGRNKFAAVTGAGTPARLPASLSLKLIWRRTGFVRGFRSDVWSLQFVRV
jgi:hypothetical protein